jgi:hemin uptake protein HemP
MMGGTDRATLGAEDTTAETPRLAVRRLESAALLAGAREIEIDHHGELYRLRCTNKGKLILTK